MTIIWGCQRFLKKKGLRVVSAGHIFDPLFLFRFYHLCSIHEYSACNQIGTHVFYAQYAGCKHFTIDAGDVSSKGNDENIEWDLPNDTKEYIKNINKLFSSPLESTDEINYIFDPYMSSSKKKSKIGLQALILNTELIHLGCKLLNSRFISKYRKILRFE